MGRRKRYYERMIAAFPEGTFKAIDRYSHRDQDRTEFVRIAVNNEIAARKMAIFYGYKGLRKKAPSPLAQGSGQ